MAEGAIYNPLTQLNLLMATSSCTAMAYPDVYWYGRRIDGIVVAFTVAAHDDAGQSSLPDRNRLGLNEETNSALRGKRKPQQRSLNGFNRSHQTPQSSRAIHVREGSSAKFGTLHCKEQKGNSTHAAGTSRNSQMGQRALGFCCRLQSTLNGCRICWTSLL